MLIKNKGKNTIRFYLNNNVVSLGKGEEYTIEKGSKLRKGELEALEKRGKLEIKGKPEAINVSKSNSQEPKSDTKSNKKN